VPSKHAGVAIRRRPLTGKEAADRRPAHRGLAAAQLEADREPQKEEAQDQSKDDEGRSGFAFLERAVSGNMQQGWGSPCRLSPPLCDLTPAQGSEQ
jgi:hypothetical protein